MFTIKWKDKNGSEALWQGHGLNYTPAKENKETGKATLRFLLGPETGESQCSIDSGRVFVMNENGKTVADYFFDEHI